jgi:hypothetical protein
MLPLILVGFAMMTLGVALLLLGEVPFIAGKRIPAGRSRLIGVVLVSFLPLALAVREVIRRIFDEDTVDGPVLTWALCGFCWFLVVVILFRVLVPKRAPRKPAAVKSAAKANPFGGVEPEQFDVIEEIVEEEPTPAKKPAAKKAAPEPVQKPSAKKSRKPADGETDPFDFT